MPINIFTDVLKHECVKTCFLIFVQTFAKSRYTNWNSISILLYPCFIGYYTKVYTVYYKFVLVQDFLPLHLLSFHHSDCCLFDWFRCRFLCFLFELKKLEPENTQIVNLVREGILWKKCLNLEIV